MGEVLDVQPKAQCKTCLLYWKVGIVYCTCGHFLQDGTEENKKFVKYTLDLLSKLSAHADSDELELLTESGESKDDISISTCVDKRRKWSAHSSPLVSLLT